MRNKTLTRLVKVLGFFLTVGAIPAAQAVQQITMSIPDCPSGQTLSFNNNTLGCSGSVVTTLTPADCSIAASPSSASGNGLAASTLVTLTATCNTNTTNIRYTWSTGTLGASIQVAPGATTTYSVTPSNDAGTANALSTTVYIGNTVTGPTVPTNCAVGQNPNTAAAAVTAGTTVTLSVTCGQNAPTSCAWSSGIGSTSCSVNVTAPSANTSYSVTPSNASGAGNSLSTTINVAINPIGNATNYCTGSDSIINVSWPAGGQVRPSTNGFGNQKIAFKITIPNTFSPALNINHLGFARAVEVPGAQVTSRDFTVSKNPCDFQSGNYLYNAIGYGDTAPGANYTVNNPTGYFAVGANFNVNSGDVIYVNVRNANNGIPSCPSSSCDILFDFATPNRY